MLASVIAILMMLVFPLGTIESSAAYFNVSALGISSVTPEVVLDVMSYDLLVILIAMMALPLVCIFLYNKRKLQVRILLYTLILDLIFYIYFFAYEAGVLKGLASEALQSSGYDGTVSATYSVTLWLMPVISIFGCVMAWKGVMYDIALLSSADRLRPSRKK